MTEEIPALSFQEVDFVPEKEVWNVYELGDRSTLKIRAILVKLLKPRVQRKIPVPGRPELEGQEFRAKFQNILAVTKAESSLMGKPTSPLPLSELEKMERLEVSYTPFQEDWNIYVLPEGSRIKVKLVVSSVFRIKGQYDELGYPMYLVNSTNAITPVPKP